MEHGIIYRVSFRFIHCQYYPAFAAEMSSEKGIQFEVIFIASSLIHDAWLIKMEIERTWTNHRITV